MTGHAEGPPYPALDAVKHLRAAVLVAWSRGLDLAGADAEGRADALQAMLASIKEMADEHLLLLGAAEGHDRYADGRLSHRLTPTGEGTLFARVIHPHPQHPANSGTMDWSNHIGC